MLPDTQPSSTEEKLKKPYPGPLAYTKDDTKLYGREDEAAQLLDLLLTRRIVLLHSPSGAGKTSLIQAKIIPDLRNENIVAHPNVRLHNQPTGPLPVNRYIYSTQLSLIPDYKVTPNSPTLAVFCEQLTAVAPKNQHFLFFDQFEEVFSLDEHDGAAKREFFEQLGPLLYDRKWMAVFAIREDYVSILETYEHYLPNNLSTHYRLERLEREGALDAIRFPVEEEQFGYRYAEGAAEIMLGKLNPGRSQFVEPVLLQVACSTFWDSVQKYAEVNGNGERVIAKETVENFNIVTSLAQFYEAGIDLVARSTDVSVDQIRNWFSDKLLDRGSDTGKINRKMVLKQDEQVEGIPIEVVRSLVDTRLVRQLPPQDGRIFFELTHDRLIEPVLNANRDAEQRRLRVKFLRRASAAISVFGILFAIAGVIATLAVQSSEQATLARQNALIARNQALLANAQSVGKSDPLIALALAVEVAASENPPAQASDLLAGLAFAPGVRYRLRAPSGVDLLAYSPDGESLITSLIDGSLVAWDVASGTKLRDLGVLASPATSLAFSPRGDVFVTGGQAGELDLRDATTGGVIHSFSGLSSSVRSVAFSPQGELLLSCSGNNLVLWDIATGKELHRFQSDGEELTSVAFSPNGITFASGLSNGTLILWNVASWEPIWRSQAHIDEILGLAFSPNGELLLSGSGDTEAKVWDVATGKVKQTFRNDTSIGNVAFYPDGVTAVTAQGGGEIVLWNTTSGERTSRFKLDTIGLTSLVISPNGRTIALGSKDSQLLIWDTNDAAIITSSPQPGLVQARLAASPDGHTVLFSGCTAGFLLLCLTDTSGRLILWDIDKNAEIGRYKDEATLNGLVVSAFSPTGDRIVSATTGGKLFLWDPKTGSELRTLASDNADNPLAELVFAVAFSPDGKTVLSGGCQDKKPTEPLNSRLQVCSTGELLSWNANTGEMLYRFDGLDGIVTSTAFSADGRYILTGSSSGTLTLWSAAPADFGSLLRIFEGGSRASFGIFSPDGKYILSGSSDDTLILWDVATGRRIRSYTGHTGSVNTITFSPDGLQAASTSNDQSVILWNVATGEIIRRFNGHTDAARGLVFVANGDRLVSTSDDRTYIVWNIGGSLADVLTWTLRNRYVREFTCDERSRFGLDTEPYCSETGVYPTRTPLPTLEATAH